MSNHISHQRESIEALDIEDLDYGSLALFQDLMKLFLDAVELYFKSAAMSEQELHLFLIQRMSELYAKHKEPSKQRILN